MPAYQAMVAANQKQIGQGEADILEKFGTKGMRFGSDALHGVQDYQTDVAKQFASILQQYLLGTQGQVMNSQLGAAQTAMAPFAAAGMQTYAPAALVSGPSPMQQIMGGAEGILAMLLAMQK
jgi:hypothetical protein